MKICLPTIGERGIDEMVGEHFGRVPTYTIFDTETEEASVIKNNTLHMGGSGYAPDLIAGAGADVMLCDGLGRRAINMFQEKGIDVYVGARGTVKQALDMFEKGLLTPATDNTACNQHAFRGEGHGDGQHGHGGKC